MIVLKNIIIVAALVTLAGCGSTPAKVMQPAVLIKPSSATTQVLNRAVSQALNGAMVSLARNVLIDTSELQIERMAQGSPSMLGVNGSLMGAPNIYRFSLKKSDSGECVLFYPKAGSEYRLDGVKCRTL